MKLERNVNQDGRGKYGLVNNRRLTEIISPVGDSSNARDMADVDAMKVRDAVKLLESVGVIDWGYSNTESEFFAIKLRDLGARHALGAYAAVYRGRGGDREYADEVEMLARRSGPASRFCKRAD